MGFVSNLFKGSNYKADTGANGGDAVAQRKALEDSIAQQQAFVNATGAQNGLQNQSSVFNQLQGVADGTGANPAQAMLNQATGQNVANQAALMASQRGVSANPGMIARQAANQGANLQQQAVGQGATMQANQSLGALSQLGGIAGQQVGQQQNALNSLQNQQANEQQMLLNAASNASQINAGVAAQNQQQKMGILKGVTGAIAKGASMAGGGGGMAEGGVVGAPDVSANGPKSKAAQHLLGLSGQPLMDNTQGAIEDIGDVLGFGAKAGAAAMAPGAPQGMVAPTQGMDPNALNLGNSSPMMAMGNASQMPQFKAKGGNVGGKLKAGGKVPGKPKIGGAKDHYANDNVQAVLSPGEVVLPRSVTQSKDPVGNAAKFVAAIMAKQSMKGKKK